MIDPQSPVPRRILEARQASMQDWLQAQDMDSLVVFAQGSVPGTATRSHGNLRYLIDFDADNAPSALVLPAHGPLSLVVGNVFASMGLREQGWIPQVRLARGPAFGTAVLDLLPAGATRIGLIGRDEIPLAIWSTLGPAAAAWTDCTAELARRRSIKDAVQIAYHREAARICDQLFAHLGPTLRTGIPVFQVQAELERLGRASGCELCRTWLTVMPVPDRCRYWREENRTIPQDGDQVLLGIMLILHGHWGHAIRTGYLGAPNDGARQVFAQVEAMHAAMLAGLHPGADLKAAGDAGLLAARPGQFQFRSGHAMGHSYEDPVGTAEFPQPYDPGPPVPPRQVAAGMLFEVHPNLFVAGLGGASIGDMVLVGPDGPELLTKFPRGLVAF